MPQISSKKGLDQSRCQYTVTVDDAERAKAEEAALVQFANSAKIPGFRPGKAPVEMIKEKISKADLLEEIVRQVLPGSLRTIIERDALRPLLQPKVELTAESPLTLTVTFVERPEAKVKGLEKLKIEKNPPKVDAKDVDRMVEYLLNQYRDTQTVERAAIIGDEVTIDFKGSDSEGKEIPGTASEGYKVVLGSKSLIPGFEEALAGLKAGEEKTFTVTFPEKYHAEHLAGKPATFWAKMHRVDEVKMPSLTDDFVKEKKLGDSASAFRGKIEDSLKEQEEHMERQRREGALFDALVKATTVELAPELIEVEARSLAEDLGEQLKRQKRTLEQWLQESKKTPSQLKEDLEAEAKKRLTLRFGLEKALEMKGITVTKEEVDAVAKDALSTMTPEERSSMKNDYEEGGDAYERLRWQKTVEKFIAAMLD